MYRNAAAEVLGDVIKSAFNVADSSDGSEREEFANLNKVKAAFYLTILGLALKSDGVQFS